MLFQCQYINKNSIMNQKNNDYFQGKLVPFVRNNVTAFLLFYKLLRFINIFILYNRMVKIAENDLIQKQSTKKLPIRNSKKPQIQKQAELLQRQKTLFLKQKNRESAQRSRDNKKKYIQGLNNRINELLVENQYLINQLRNCKCSKIIEDNIASSTQEEDSDNKKNNKDDLDRFQRISIKSYGSCSNFLMLAIVVVFCIFGFFDINGLENSRIPSSLYSITNIESAVTKYNFPQCLIMFQSSKKFLDELQDSLARKNLTPVSYKIQQLEHKQKWRQTDDTIYSKSKCEELQPRTIQLLILEKMKKIRKNYTNPNNQNSMNKF